MTDRTADFVRLARELASQSKGSASLPPRGSSPKEASAFAQSASRMSNDVYLISQKLSKLTQMVQSKSIFNDPTNNINRLTCNIKEDIQRINFSLDTMETDTRAAQLPQQGKSHAKQVVGSLKTRLMDTTANFREVLHTRTRTMKVQQDRRHQYSGGAGGGAGGSGGTMDALVRRSFAVARRLGVLHEEMRGKKM